MSRYDADGGQAPTTLFEAAAFHRTIKARCPLCRREAVFHAAALWWLFQQRQWPAHFDYVPERLRCTGCGQRDVPIVAGRDAPTVTSLQMLDEREWKRAVSRFSRDRYWAEKQPDACRRKQAVHRLFQRYRSLVQRR